MKKFLLTVLLLTGCGADEQSTSALLPCSAPGVAPFNEMGQPAEVTPEQCREYYGCNGEVIEVDGELMMACNK